MMCRYLLSLLAAATLLIPRPAFAWDGAKTGRVVRIEATAGNNFAIRVYLDGVDEICGPGSVNWAYINDTASNYQAYVSYIVAARSSGAQLTIYSTAVQTFFGRLCEIGYIVW